MRIDFRSLRSIFLFLPALAVLWSCDAGYGTGAVIPVQITIEPGSVLLTAIGDTTRLEARLVNEHGDVVEGTVGWTTSDAGVAEVNPEGVVTAIGPGSTQVVAESEASSDTATVQVRQEPVRLQASVSRTTLTALGDSAELAAAMIDRNGHPVAGGVEWQASDTLVVAISAAGDVAVARSNGTAVLTASADGLEDTVLVRVAQAPVRLEASVGPDTLTALGDTARLSASVWDANGHAVAAEIAWGSTDTAVAVLTGSSAVVARANGRTSLVASHGGLADTVPLVVVQRAARLEVSAEADTLTAWGDKVALTALVQDRNGHEMTDSVAWATSDSTVVALSDESGAAVARGNGRAVVTASAGTLSDSVTIWVMQEVARLEAAVGADTLTALGDTAALTASAFDRNGAPVAGTVSWSVDTLVVALTDDGASVVARANGRAALIATAGALADTLTLWVTQEATDVRIAVETDTFTALADTMPVSARVADRRGNAVADAELVWSVSDTLVVTLDEVGERLVSRGNGRAVLTASSGEIVDSLLIFVSQAVVRVEIGLTSTAIGVGDTLQAEVLAWDTNAFEAPAPECSWGSTDEMVLSLPGPGRIAGEREGTADLHLSCGTAGTDTTMVSVSDEVASLTLSVDSALLEVADTLVLRTDVRGRTGNVLARAVTWTCSSMANLESCGQVVRPKFQPMDAADTVEIVASAEGVADTALVVVHEAELQSIMVDFEVAPIGFVGDATSSSTALSGVVGVDAVMYVLGVMPDGSWQATRPFRLVVDDSTVARATLGDSTGMGRRLIIRGLRADSTVISIAAKGAETKFRIEVTERRDSTCLSEGTLSLDMSVGDAYSFRGTDPDAPGCLEFLVQRDLDRQYMVAVDLVPEITGAWPNSALEMFDFEGQALYHVSGAASPAEYPPFRLYNAGEDTTTILAVEADELEGHGMWRIAGETAYELPPQTRMQSGHALMAAEAAPLAVGDTLPLPVRGSLESGAARDDGSAPRDSVVVTYIGANIIFAEQIDVAAGSLVLPSGVRAATIPAEVYVRLDSASAAGRKQLDRIFGPYGGTAAGRNGGGLILMVNAPLAPSYWGLASQDYALFNYWLWSDHTTPGAWQEPVTVADGVITHELTHVRHLQAWQGTVRHPWFVEGFAEHGSYLAHAARVLGSDSPSRTGRVQAEVDWAHWNYLPAMDAESGSSFFGGYRHSASFFAYVADHVEAAGGDAMAALRDLAAAPLTKADMDAAVAAHLPGETLTAVLTRSRIARFMELHRRVERLSLDAQEVPMAAIQLDEPALPDWTRYLQYDLPAMDAGLITGNLQSYRVVRPGADFGMAFRLRTGAGWVTYIDGARAAADQRYVVDVSGEPQAVWSVVRVR